MLKNHRPT